MNPSPTSGPGTLLFLKDKNKDLYSLIRYLSKQRFADISARKVSILEDHPQPDDFVYGSHQTIIQIASRDLRVTFKSHFKLSDTVALLSSRRRASADQKAFLKPIYDLFMEYSNLVAGGISQQLHTNGVVAGISLPMATSGFDELIASDEIRLSSYFDYWIVRGEDFKFTCTVNVDILDEDWLKSFHFAEEGVDNETHGGIEFL